jgi:hypothetical protein
MEKRCVYYLCLLLLLCSSCASTSSIRKADSKFYQEHSQKLGINFKGNEERGVIKASTAWLGVPYRYGGQSRKGVDCSALVGHVYREAYGVTLPRTTAAIAKQVKRVKKKDLACGDLLFFTIKGKNASHMGVYLAESKFVHAATSKGVSIANLNDSYWSKYFVGAGRMYEQKSEQKSPTEPPSSTGKQKPVKAVKSKPKKQQPNDNDDDVIIVFDEEF